MVIYAAACDDCSFTIENYCDASVHTVAERHAAKRGHNVVYGSFEEKYIPTVGDEISQQASYYTP